MSSEPPSTDRAGKTSERFGWEALAAVDGDSRASATEVDAGGDVVGPSGALFDGPGRVRRPDGEPAGAGAVPNRSRFEIVLRGYERRQVDAYVAEQARLARAALEASERKLLLANRHAEATEVENRHLRAALSDHVCATGEQGFGTRAEKFLRMAESEAADLRAKAVRETAALLEQARADAEKSRHEAEVTLIARAAELERGAGLRDAELRERENDIAAQRATIRDDAEKVHAAAVAAADRLRREAEAEAVAARWQRRSEAEVRCEEARLEIEHLKRVREAMYAEVGRIADVIAAELRSGPDHPVRRSGPAPGRLFHDGPGGAEGASPAAGEFAARPEIVRRAAGQ